jgi:MazG family protein
MSVSTDNLARLLEIMERLRGPDGCPWDREQDHRSIRHNLIEETYEVIEALDALPAGDADDPSARAARSAFCDELGDLLLQVVFHAQMSAEAGGFNFDDVAGSIADKLVRRHPHVFGGTEAADSAAVLHQWERIKREEKGGAAAGDAAGSIYAELPVHLPALVKADKVQRKAARVGFDWPDLAGVIVKLEEEIAELKQAQAAGDTEKIAEEIGDLLFTVVNLARYQQFHAEELLNRAVSKFVSRFQQVEQAVHADGRQVGDCSLEELDAFWDAVKTDRRGDG